LQQFKKKLPLKIVGVQSKGKFMWVTLQSKDEKEYYIMNTFGLAGEWDFTRKTHSGVEFVLKNSSKGKEYKLYFTDPRNFGTIVLTNDRKDVVNKLNSLGSDFLKKSFTTDQFCKRISDYVKLPNGKISESKGKKEVVKVLMDQTKKGGIGSGLGNYLVVESLYRAEISPYKTMYEMYKDPELCKKLAEAIKYIIKISFMTADIGYFEHLDKKILKYINKIRQDIKTDPNHDMNFHKDIDLGDDKFEFKVYRQKCDPKGYKVRGDKIIKGRTTYWVPDIQK
jgi:formamidopyrimidine-DNA glycosylase